MSGQAIDPARLRADLDGAARDGLLARNAAATVRPSPMPRPTESERQARRRRVDIVRQVGAPVPDAWPLVGNLIPDWSTPESARPAPTLVRADLRASG